MTPLCASWSAKIQGNTHSTILPDGCRDLICLQRPGYAPHWFISQLQSAPHSAKMQSGDHLYGFRLAPGVKITEPMLLKIVTGLHPEQALIAQHLIDFTQQSANTIDALACLAKAHSTRDAARQLGVSARSLQRLVGRETARDPGFWRQLARIRRASRLLKAGVDLTEAAYQSGYTDQAHMNREFRRWYGVTPRTFSATPQLTDQLDAEGYF